MKTLKAKDLKPISKQDKLLDNLIRTSKSYEVYSITYDKSIDGLPKDKHYDEKDYE